MIPVDYAIAERAARLQVTGSLRLPDALVVATGIVTGCHSILTNDNKWGRLAQTFSRVGWIYLDAFR